MRIKLSIEVDRDKGFILQSHEQGTDIKDIIFDSTSLIKVKCAYQVSVLSLDKDLFTIVETHHIPHVCTIYETNDSFMTI